MSLYVLAQVDTDEDFIRAWSSTRNFGKLYSWREAQEVDETTILPYTKLVLVDKYKDSQGFLYYLTFSKHGFWWVNHCNISLI